MFRNLWIGAALAAMAISLASAQERRTRIDVQGYVINAEVQPGTQSLSAEVKMQLIPLDDNTT